MRSGPGEQRIRAFDSLAVFMLAWVWLHLRPEPPLHPDASRDLAFARDLVDGADLHLHGAWASFFALEQGTAWIDLLAVCHRLGLGIVGIERVLTSLLAFAVAAAHVGLASLIDAGAGSPTEQRTVPRLAALTGALALLVSLPVTCEMPVWWQPLLLPLPVVFVHLAAWRVLARGELIDCIALGILAALAIDVHVVAIVLLIGPLLIVPLAARRPVIATAASTAAAIGYLLLASSAAVRDNLEIVRQHGWVIPAVLVCAGLVSLGLRLRPRLAGASLRRRLELSVAVEALLVAALVLASRHDSTPELAGRYLLPFVPGLGLAVALLMTRGGDSRAHALITAGMVALGVIVGAPSKHHDERSLPLYPNYSQRELELLAREFDERGLTWVELVAGLSGPAHEELLGGLASRLEPGEPERVRSHLGLLVLALAPDDAAAVLGELPSSSEALELGDATVLLIDDDARLDRSGVSICPEDGECVAVNLAVIRRVTQAHPKAWIGAESVGQWLRERSEGPLRRVSWRIPIRPGPAKTLVLPPYAEQRCAWQFVDVDGFEAGSLPTTELELPADVDGSVVVSREYDEGRPSCRDGGSLGFPPAPLALDPAWARLRAALRGQ